MPNGTYGGVRGKETKVGQKTFVSRPTRFSKPPFEQKTLLPLKNFYSNTSRLLDFNQSTVSFGWNRADALYVMSSSKPRLSLMCSSCKSDYDASALSGQIRRPLATIIYIQIHIDTVLCRGKVISTWIFQNLHVENKKFFGGMKWNFGRIKWNFGGNELLLRGE